MDDDVQELDASFLGNVTLIGEPVPARDSRDSESSDERDSTESSDDADGFNQALPEEPQIDELDEIEEALDIEDDEPEAFEGPISWEEVDMADLEPVMLRVTNAAMPLDNNKDLAVRLEALQASLADNENEDPLGLGKIDTGNVALVRHDEIAKFMQSKKGERKKGRKTNDIMQSVASRLMSADVDIDTLRAKALPNSEKFDPDTFLGTVHAGTQLPELQKGKQNLKVEVRERTGQLKALVKENFDRFISCKNTIDDIHKRLKLSEAHGGGNGTSTSDMVVVIAEVQEEANLTFATLLDRATQSDQLKSVVATLKRYEHIFQIPARIQQGIATGDFNQVTSEYKKARSLMDSIGKPKPQSVWHKLFTEVEKGIGSAVAQLEDILRDLTVSQVTAIDSIQYILQLQVEKSPSALLSSPIILYAQVKAEALLHDIQDCEHAHNIRLDSVRSQEEQDLQPVAQEFDGPPPDPNEDLSDPTPEGIVWAKFYQDLSSMGGHRLLGFWHAPQGKLSQSMVPGVKSIVEQSNDRIIPMVLSLARRLEKATNDAIGQLCKHNSDHPYLMGIVSLSMKDGSEARKAHAPDVVCSMIESHAAFACEGIIEQMILRVKNIAENMPTLEDFRIISSSHKAGHPASRVPGMLRRAIAGCMTQLEAIVNEAAQASPESAVPDPLSEQYSLLRRAFCDSFSSFALAVDKLWGSLLAQEPSQGLGQGMPRDIKLLVLQSNCVHLRTHILKDMVTRFGTVLTGDGGVREHKQLMGDCVEDMRVLEGKLANIYIKARVERLNELLDEYFEEDGTDWRNAPIPTGVRDCAFAIIDCLVSVQAEVYENALSLQRKAMDEVFQHFVSAFNSCIDDIIEGLSMGGTLQLLLELQFFIQATGHLSKNSQQKGNVLKQAKSALLNRVTRLATDLSSPSFSCLDEWCSSTGGTHSSYRADVVSNLKSLEIIEATRFNTASLKA